MINHLLPEQIKDTQIRISKKRQDISRIDRNAKIGFFNDVDVISVPVRKYDGYGYISLKRTAEYQLFSLLRVPFGDNKVNGRWFDIFTDTIEALSAALLGMLNDKDLRISLGKAGRKR
jgi:hypothetical protein